MASSARIDELRKKFDENPRRYFAPLANEYRKAGDFEQAIFICQEYLPQQPGHMSGHIVLGQALFEAKRLPEARTVFETALTLDPENLIALRHLADISRDLGEVAVARGWYERVLQADPRNEEIAAIMTTLSASRPATSPAAPTADIPAVPAPAGTPVPSAPPATPAPIAPTVVEMSASAIQEMVRARQAAKTEETPAKTLDETPLIDLTAPTDPEPMEGLEPTARGDTPGASTGGMAEVPTGGLLDSTSDEPSTFDIPSGGMLGLEPTAAAAPPPEMASTVAATDGLDTLSLEDFSVPAAKAPLASAPTSKPPEPEGGLLDLDSLELGGGESTAPAARPVPTTASAPPVAADSPIDGAHDGPIDFDFELPAAPAAAAQPAAPPAAQPAPPAPAAQAEIIAPALDNVPTIVMDAINAAVPSVVEAVQQAVPAIVDLVEDIVPAVVDAASAGPTVILDAVRPDAPAAPPPTSDSPQTPPAPAPEMELAPVKPATDSGRPDKPAPPAPAFVTETMAQLYLEQGHRAEALDIYRQLVAAKPNDAELRARFDAIERGVGPAGVGQPSPAAVPPRPATATPVVSRTFNRAGPSIREVLRGVFGIDGSERSGNGHAATSNADQGTIDVLFSAPAGADELDPLAAAFDGGHVAQRGTIDAVFDGGAH